MDSGMLLTLRAADFAARAHRRQRRKDEEATPYINHLIEVAFLLGKAGARDVVVAAGYLHDTVEDTSVTADELSTEFSEEIVSLVLAVTDDKSLPKDVRKNLQVEHARTASREVGMIKVADKISNLRALLDAPPANWPMERMREYVNWAHRVVSSLPDPDPFLIGEYESVRERHLR
jgi:guanosine-3',5'-bis(diphosphate) 3'-pyrophosphohydrolase